MFGPWAFPLMVDRFERHVRSGEDLIEIAGMDETGAMEEIAAAAGDQKAVAAIVKQFDDLADGALRTRRFAQIGGGIVVAFGREKTRVHKEQIRHLRWSVSSNSAS